MTRIPILAAALTLALSGLASAQDGVPPPSATATSQTSPVRPGDVVKVQIWREEDLSGEFPVHEDGSVVLPRIGPYPAAGKTPEQLRYELVDAFSQTLRNPSINISVLLRVSIVGEVRRPGLYTVDPTMSVSDALAMAGGPNPNSNKSKLVVLRNGEEMEIDLEEKYSVVDLQLRSGDRIYVPERSWFVRNLGLIGSVLGLTTSIIALATR